MRINKLHLLVFFGFFVFSSLPIQTFGKKKSYVVYFGEHSHGPEPTSAHFNQAENKHHEFLGSFLGGKEKAKETMVYSHTKHINAFSAMLEPEEAEEISKHEDVISVFEGKPAKLHTTKSWKFLGVEKYSPIKPNWFWEKASYGEDIIIGNIDTGVWPKSYMFNDTGMGPIPPRWKGRCNDGDPYDGSQCNRKLIAMRKFDKHLMATCGEMIKAENITLTATDEAGHGTHTITTAGGRFTTGVNVYGYQNATIKGGLPNARLASYKVSFANVPDAPTFEEDIIAAFDEATHDGVDVLSVSLGSGNASAPVEPDAYLRNGFAIGSLHAVRQGIAVVCAGSNFGPGESLIDNIWPWVITVGASSIDRKYSTFVHLGNGQRFKGASITNEVLKENKLYPLVSYADATPNVENTTNIELLMQCIPEAELDRKKVKDTIVIIETNTYETAGCAYAVFIAGGAGMIVFDYGGDSEELIADTYHVPTARLTRRDGAAILSYMNNTEFPVAHISPGMIELNTKPAPMVASFSARGPNLATPEILKPDIVAPGVEIISAMQLKGPIKDAYNVQSGTSMAAPHVAGVVGLLKAIHPDWSPAMIKSAIMTTASTVDNTNEPIKDFTSEPANPFAMGAGHIQPTKAMSPGLVYDLTNDDYLLFLCATGLNNVDIAQAYNATFSCPESYDLLNFNYPAIVVPRLKDRAVLKRSLKNVDRAGMYKAQVVAPEGISVTVNPTQLMFVKVGEEKSFEVTVTANNGAPKDHVFGQLVWSDGVHYVTTPIIILKGDV